MRPIGTPSVRHAPEADGAIGDSLYILLCGRTWRSTLSGEANLVVYRIVPVSPSKTLGTFEYYDPADTLHKFRTALQDFFWDWVGFEDVGFIQLPAQRGPSSGSTPLGRLAMCRETLAHAFQS